MASLVDLLPLEVIEHILDIVANNDRHEAPRYSYPNTKACALVCHSLLLRCRSHIFHSIRLYERLIRSRGRRPLASSFARLIINNPGIADHVRKLHYIFQNESPELDQRIEDALEHLKGLETLVFQPESVALDWDQCLKVPSRSPILRLLHAPSILSLKLISVHGFRLSDLIPCTNLKELDLTRVYITEEEEMASRAGLPFEPLCIRRLDLRYTEVESAEKMVKQRGPDGTHILNLGELISIGVSIDTLEDKTSALNIIERVRGLETLHVIVGRSLNPTGAILPLVSSSLETLSNLSLTLNINEGSRDPLCGICGLFQTISGKNRIQVLDIFIRIPKHLSCSTGDEWGTLEKVLLSPGWSSLIQLDVKIIANGARENMWLEKALRKLPQTQLHGLSSSKTLKFSFSADEGLPG